MDSIKRAIIAIIVFLLILSSCHAPESDAIVTDEVTTVSSEFEMPDSATFNSLAVVQVKVYSKSTNELISTYNKSALESMSISSTGSFVSGIIDVLEEQAQKSSGTFMVDEDLSQLACLELTYDKGETATVDGEIIQVKSLMIYFKDQSGYVYIKKDGEDTYAYYMTISLTDDMTEFITKKSESIASKNYTQIEKQ